MGLVLWLVLGCTIGHRSSVDMWLDGSLWQDCRELRAALVRCGRFSCSTLCVRTRRYGQRELPVQWPSAAGVGGPSINVLQVEDFNCMVRRHSARTSQ